MKIVDGNGTETGTNSNPWVIADSKKTLSGVYLFSSGNQSIGASAHGATAGFFWIINPVGSSKTIRIRKLRFTSAPTAATAFVSSPRVTIERMTFTGTSSGATITPTKRNSSDNNATGLVITATTGLTPSAGAVARSFVVAPILTAVGASVPSEQVYEPNQEQDMIILAAGEGIVCRQADAGTTADTRKCVVDGTWEEYS